eukprot:gene40000-49451_t
MSSKSSPPAATEQNPAEIAREAFRRLATRRIAPTPEAYRDIYHEIAGIPVPPPAPVLAGTAAPADPGPELMLYQFASRLGDQPGDLAEFGRRLSRAVKARDWEGYARTLTQLAERPAPAKRGIDVADIPDGEHTKALREAQGAAEHFAHQRRIPALAHQGGLGHGRRRRSLDRLDELVDIGQRDGQAFQHVAAF